MDLQTNDNSVKALMINGIASQADLCFKSWN